MIILRADLDEDEYEGTKRDTLEQLDEIGMSLKKFTSGDLTLVNSVNALQLVNYSS